MQNLPDMTRLLYPDAEAREILGGIGRTTLYGLTKEGKITPVKIGRRTFYDHDARQPPATTRTVAAGPSAASPAPTSPVQEDQ